MPSTHDYVNRILDETRQAISPHASALEVAFESLKNHLLTSLEQLAPKLEAIKGVELPKIGRILTDAIQESVWQNQLEVNLLAEFSGGMRRKETQEEILTLLLDTSYQFAPGVALFVVRGDEMAGWSSRGLSADTAGRFGSCSFAVADSQLLHKALGGDGVTTFAHPPEEPRLQEIFQGEPLVSWHILPMRALQRPIALLVAFDTNERRCNMDSLRIVMEFTSLCVENLALKILQEMRSTEAPAGEPAPQGASVEAARPPRPADVGPESGPSRAAEAPAPPETAVHPVIKDEVEELPLPGQAPGPMPAATPHLREVEKGAPTRGPIEIPAPRSPVLAPPMSEEEKLHSDAKRFARLLVSEIKLYNEQRLQEARAGGDIYIKLKRDIDRSREMYEKRIPSSVQQKADYFHNEIVRILAENDPAKLGSDYPGPRGGS
jgi:hypothetical protein